MAVVGKSAKQHSEQLRMFTIHGDQPLEEFRARLALDS
jgi:hypothetical protein